jgi:hypothetical protein
MVGFDRDALVIGALILIGGVLTVAAFALSIHAF